MTIPAEEFEEIARHWPVGDDIRIAMIEAGVEALNEVFPVPPYTARITVAHVFTRMLWKAERKGQTIEYR